MAVLADLFKLRLTLLVVLTAGAGFYLGTRGEVNYLSFLNVMLGTGLLACGAAALNQLIERDLDAKMARTADRPLPSGRMQPATVLLLGSTLSLIGLLWLAYGSNLTTALLGAATLLSYLFIYTPLKTQSWTNTLAGAVPGALPPLIGWTAARGDISTVGLVLFSIQALWQIPHFMAIAWIYRNDYAKAGFKMLPGQDPAGTQTGWLGLIFTLLLIPVSLIPFTLGACGPIYGTAAMLLGVAFALMAGLFAWQRTISRARHLFLMSVLYLPVLIGILVFDKT